MSRLALRGLCALFGTVVYATIALAQGISGGTLTINGTFINAGTLSVTNHIINNTAGAVSVLPGATASRVRISGGTAAGHYVYGGGPISFYRLDIDGARETRFEVDVRVTNRLQIGYTGFTFTGADSGLTIKNHTLTIDSVATYLGTANLTFAGGTVVYDNSNAATQTLISKASGVRYGTLNLSGTSAKSITTAGTDSAATLTQTGGQLSLTGNLDVTGTGSFADVGAISAAKKLRLTSTATAGVVTSLNNSSTGTFENASNASDTITTLAGNGGTINQSGASGTIVFTNAAVNTGTITTATGTIKLNNNLSGTGTITLSGNGNVLFGGSVAQTTYNLNNGTTTYNSTTAQSIIATPYNNLTIASATDTSAANYKTAANTLTVNGNLVVNAGNTLDMKTYSTSTIGAGSNNLGKLMWQGNNVFVGGTGVTEFYGSSATTVATGATYGNILFTGSGAMTISSAVTAIGGNAPIGVHVSSNLTLTGTLTVTGMDFVNDGTFINSGTLTTN